MKLIQDIFQEILFSPFQLLYMRTFRSVYRVAILLRNQSSGFTLIELLLAIVVVGILAAGVFALMNPVKQFGNARNSQRRTDLRMIANALEEYAVDHGGYPVTGVGVWCNTSGTGTYACGGNNRLGGLIPIYLKRIPIDPRNNQPNLFNPSCTTTNAYGYLYRSDTGTDYKILAYCSPEVNQVSATDSMKDPSRTTTSWSFYSPGGRTY